MIAAKHLIGYWRSETLARIGKDASGNGNDGVNTDVAITDGKFGNCGDYNGTSSHLNLGGSMSLTPTANLTVSFWANHTAFNIGAAISLGGNSGGKGVNLFSCIGGNVRFITQINGSNKIINIPTVLLPINSWNHYAATYNGVDFVLYLNGTEYSRINAVGTITYQLTSSLIGRFGGTSFYFKGKIDEVTVWNKAYLESDIKRIMSNYNPLAA